MAEVGAQTGPQQGGNQARDPLINVRDRLFHTLFFKLSVAYARGSFILQRILNDNFMEKFVKLCLHSTHCSKSSFFKREL